MNFRIARSAASKFLAATGLALMAAAPASATDGYFLHGAGAKAKGSGGAAIAYPQDALAITANPAAATELGHRVDVGFDIFVPDRSVRIAGNAFGADQSYSGNNANPFVLPEFGYAVPLSEKLSFALAIYANGGMNTDYKRNPFERFGATGEAGIDLKQVFITPTLAVRVADGHSLGISVIGVAQSFRAKGIAPFAAASADPANFTDNGEDWAWGGGVRVGWLGHLTDRLSAGAFYQSKVWTTRFERYAGLFADRGGFDVPASWGGGLAYRLTDRLDMAADVKRIEYSGIGSVGNSLAPLFAGVPFGAAGGPGFGWKDITVYKFGAVYKASPTWTLRAGYGRAEQPIPASQTFLNILAPGVVQDHFTLGATWTAPSGMEVTGHVLRAPRQTVHGQGSIPPGNPPGFGGGEADISLAETAAGLSFGFKF